METKLTSQSDLDEVVNVPVPRKHLGVVYAALAAAMNADGDDRPVEASEERIYVEGQGPWTKEMVGKLRSRLAHPGTKALLTMVAERAPKEVTLAEFNIATGIPVLQVRAQLAVMSKLTKKLFGDITWPMSHRWSEGGVANYYMDETIARWWLERGDGEQ